MEAAKAGCKYAWEEACSLGQSYLGIQRCDEGACKMTSDFADIMYLWKRDGTELAREVFWSSREVLEFFRNYCSFLKSNAQFRLTHISVRTTWLY